MDFLKLPFRGRVVYLLALAWLAGAGSLPAAGPDAFAWTPGQIEVARYSIEAGGTKKGEIEQILYGVDDPKRGKRYRLVNELIRQAEVVNQQPVIGRLTTEIFFDPDTLELLERVDSLAAGDTEAQARTERVPEGLRLTTESMSGGIPRADQVDVVPLQGSGAVVDQMALSFFVRALPMVEDYRFTVRAVAPIQKTVDELRGRVGPVQFLDWGGRRVEVRRVEVSSARGTSSFYLLTDRARTLVRYVSYDQEIYQRVPGRAEKPAKD